MGKDNRPARPAPAAPAPPPRVVTPCPNCLVVRITEIVGLYKPGVDDRDPADENKHDGTTKNDGTTQAAGYEAGYTSSDNGGRIFINSVPGTPPKLINATWTKKRQYVDITVVIDPPSIPIPPGSKVTWSFEDPDDPSNEGPDVHVEAGRVLDPNDYDPPPAPAVKIGANAGDNNPNSKPHQSPGFEQLERKYALIGNDTLIDIPSRTSRVRFNVSNIAGDNWIVKATVLPIAPITAVTPAKTGIMTAWNRIQVEYVKMGSAAELPVDQIALHYDKAFAQVDVSEKRVVFGRKWDKQYMAIEDDDAYAACVDYATKAKGQFTKEGEKGWFFIAAANLYQRPSRARILYEDDATVVGDRSLRLKSSQKLAGTPAVVRIFNSAALVGWPKNATKPNDRAIHTKFKVDHREGHELILEPHIFLDPDPHSQHQLVLLARLSNYGFTSGSTVPIQVLTEGTDALVTDGISPLSAGGGFSGRLLVFTRSDLPSELLGTMCHELCHAFDNNHWCGNWDWIDQSTRTACCMNYWFMFVLDDASPRAPIRWTQNRTVNDLCGPHLRRMRDYHLEDNPDLGW
jgi:hypothetical protein